jgi:ABC-type transporter lipoprotein component MlaA
MSYFRQYLLVLMFSLFVTSLHANEKECFEKASRAVFKFNQTLDNVLIGPLAKGYNKLPEPIRKGTGNFTGECI